jgi:hypothetical protein
MTSLSEFVSSIENGTKWHGNHFANNNRITLRAGSLSMIYENGNLRYISDGKNELIRMIYSALRDREWCTIVPVITGEKIVVNPDSFNIEYDCLYRSGKISFSARYKIEGRADNTLTFGFEGITLDTFEKNRIGFCVLHPIEGYTGINCIITHSDNNSETLKFPVIIAPHQPFIDIKSMNWRIGETACSLNFFGDVFETEDQRNWTDASYKTYCTPLAEPFPVAVKKGTTIKQRVEFKADGIRSNHENDNNPTQINLFQEVIYPFPGIGIGESSCPELLDSVAIETLKCLPFDHYRIQLLLFNDSWKQKALKACTVSKLLSYKAEFVLFFDDNAIKQVCEFIELVESECPDIKIITLFHMSVKSTPDWLCEAVVPLLKKAMPWVKTCCGTNANFAQLNRSRPETDLTDYICYSIHPQEHAHDNSTIIENLRGQAFTVESAKTFSGKKGIWISPVNIQRRFNANVDSFETPSSSNDFPSRVDSRMMSLLGACWCAGSLKYLLESEVKGVTFFETTGERGIIQGAGDSSWPGKFSSVKGMIFPVYHIFYWLLKYKTFRIMKSESTRPLIAESLILTDGSAVKMVLVNFTSSFQKVKITGCSNLSSFLQLNSGNFAEAAGDPNWIENTAWTTIVQDANIDLEPFSVSFIEGRVYL